MTGCSGYYTEHLTGNYWLSKVDYDDEELDVCYDLGNDNFVGVVAATVYAVGYDDDFIIVMQHPRRLCDSTFNPQTYNFLDEETHYDITHYYIIPLRFKVHHSPDENRIGPLSYEEYRAKRKELNISTKLTFTKFYE